MARLPQPGGDSGTWGTILNEFLSEVHRPDGTLKDQTVSANTLTNGAVTDAAAFNDTTEWVAVPATAASAGLAGQKAYDATYLYVCTAPNTWQRTALSSW